MNKRQLSKIVQPEATKEMFLLAERTEKEKYQVTSEVITISEEKILLLNFFERSQLVLKKTGAAFRTFISRDDYITQDLKATRIKWKIGSFNNLIGWRWWDTNATGHDIVVTSDNDYQKICHYMKKYRYGGDISVWDAVERFQEEVLDRKLKERHKKETDKIDRKMELIPEIPEGFDKWAHDKAMADKRYLVYNAGTRKKATTGYCSSCKKTVEIDMTVMRPKNKQRGKCPTCSGDVTFIPKGYFPTYQRDRKWVCLIQRIETGIVVRYFHVFLELQRDNNFTEGFNVSELCRVLYEEDTIEIHRESYEWDVYKQHGHCRWCPGMDKQQHSDAVLYTENLPQEFVGTAFQYCAADLFQEKRGCEPIPIHRYMSNYPTKRFLEYFVKAGMISMTEAIVNGHAHTLNTSGKTPIEILDMPKNYIKLLAEIDGDEGVYRLLKQCAADKVIPDAKEIQQFHTRFGGNDELIGVINAHMSIGKFVRYMDKQKRILPVQKEQPGCHVGMMSARNYTTDEKEQMKYKDLSKDWLDYISWCAQLNYNMQDIYVMLPPNFRKAHDRVMAEYEVYKDKQARKRKAELEKQIKAVLDMVKDMPAIGMESKGLMLILPKSGEEIKNEGRILHHCVGSYVERVARGETMILFVRQIDKPEVPYFTLEFRNGKVVQCRGKNNCSMNKGVNAFVKAFEEKMKPPKQNDKSKIRQKVG